MPSDAENKIRMDVLGYVGYVLKYTDESTADKIRTSFIGLLQSLKEYKTTQSALEPVSISSIISGITAAVTDSIDLITSIAGQIDQLSKDYEATTTQKGEQFELLGTSSAVTTTNDTVTAAKDLISPNALIDSTTTAFQAGFATSSELNVQALTDAAGKEAAAKFKTAMDLITAYGNTLNQTYVSGNITKITDNFTSYQTQANNLAALNFDKLEIVLKAVIEAATFGLPIELLSRANVNDGTVPFDEIDWLSYLP